ncbi:MAG: DUF58 domain-containing protein [Gammaproteobacteria bacterium]
MKIRVIPGRAALVLVAVAATAGLAALIVGASLALVAQLTAVAVLVLITAAAADFFSTRSAWRTSKVRMLRKLPPAFAVGVQKPVSVIVQAEGALDWACTLYDHADPSFITDGMPRLIGIRAARQVEIQYAVTPTRRGEVVFEPADVHVRSRWGFCELLERLGEREDRRVFPDFQQVARYAWLAGDHRLQEIGIKTYQQRGEGTDFKQLSEYRYGDPVRHIDWKATQRMGKPVIREFQDERDQCVMLLIDSGRRMRADDRTGAIGSSHFDQVLNAVMLLSYVALKQGDAVGAMTFGTPIGEERTFSPRKGAQTLDALMGALYSVQPTPTHSDYVAAAQTLLRRYPKRALVIVITNFRDEDSSELSQALKLLRSRHLVLLASLRERVVGELIGQPMTSGEAVLDIASAHLYEQSRRDAFVKLSARDALMVDAEPERLGIELVNRYHSVKRAGLI